MLCRRKGGILRRRKKSGKERKKLAIAHPYIRASTALQTVCCVIVVV